MSPSRLAQEHFEAFIRACEPLAHDGYREAMEELASLAQMHVDALNEEDDK